MDLKEIIKKVTTNKEIARFIEVNKLTEREVMDSLPYFITQIERTQLCKECQGKKLCTQDILDVTSNLTFYNRHTDFNYHRCQYKKVLNQDFIELLFVPEQYYSSSFELYDVPPRGKIYLEAEKFLNDYKKGIYHKGMYIYGTPGVGKTCILLDLANRLANEKIKVLFTYYPDLVRVMKSSLATNNLESYISKLKNVPVLMLDDFGAENNSEFIRDEVLGPVLQHRLQEKLPVFFSSNLSLVLLRSHFEVGKNTSDGVNASRIMERVNSLAEHFELNDKNYRYN